MSDRQGEARNVAALSADKRNSESGSVPNPSGTSALWAGGGVGRASAPQSRGASRREVEFELKSVLVVSMVSIVQSVLPGSRSNVAGLFLSRLGLF